MAFTNAKVAEKRFEKFTKWNKIRGYTRGIWWRIEMKHAFSQEDKPNKNNMSRRKTL